MAQQELVTIQQQQQHKQQLHGLDVLEYDELVAEKTNPIDLILENDDEIAQCNVTLRHPGTTKNCIAYKLFTTHPRRYTVKPHQGLVFPGSSAVVTISLTGDAKDSIIEEYQNLGSLPFERDRKDKFLVQSCCVSKSFAKHFKNHILMNNDPDQDTANNTSPEDNNSHNNDDETPPSSTTSAMNSPEYDEAFNAFWISVNGPGSANLVYNQKIRVRLKMSQNRLKFVDSLSNSQRNFLQTHHNETTVSPMNSTNSAESPMTPTTKQQKREEEEEERLMNMSKKELREEYKILRSKYKELVKFTYNLATDHENLHSRLETSKRRLKREVTTRASLESKLQSLLSAVRHSPEINMAAESSPTGESTNNNNNKKIINEETDSQVQAEGSGNLVLSDQSEGSTTTKRKKSKGKKKRRFKFF